MSKSYGDLNVLSDIDYVIERGEKLAFVGRNGEGKTTMARMIMGEIPFEGKLSLGHNVKIGYFAQDQAERLNDELTVFETIDHIAVGEVRTKIRDILGAFMFGGENVDKKVKVLSVITSYSIHYTKLYETFVSIKTHVRSFTGCFFRNCCHCLDS